MAPKKVEPKKVITPAAKAASEPAAKKAKTEEKTEEEKVEEKVEEKKEEPPKEEVDAPNDARPAFKGSIGFETVDTTLNVMQASGGKVLMSYGDGGVQYLLAGARANVGMKGGRYMYEVRIVEQVSPPQGQGKAPWPHSVVRIGFSVAGSPLLLGEDAEAGIYFDTEGQFNGKKSAGCKTIRTGSVVAIILNLDAKTELTNTVSLFIDGVRSGKPQPLPEELHGKALYPHVTYRNATVQTHFGPEPFRKLPFTCRTLGSAANSDVRKTEVKPPADGKYDVLYPVGFPDEGTFEWLDGFLEKNPEYVELSDRKIIHWATKSGCWAKGGGQGSNDKPSFAFDLGMLTDGSVGRMIKTIAPLAPRPYVVMEVKGNLVAGERGSSLKRFSSKSFKKIAHVVMGEPNKEFKEKAKNKILKIKQVKLDITHKAKQAEKAKLKIIAERKAKAEEAKKSLLKKKRDAEEEKKKKEAEDKGEEYTAPEEEEDEKKEETKEEDEADEGPEQATLTDEEAKQFYCKIGAGDLTPTILNNFFTQFSVPDKSEGFDSVVYEWQKEKGAKAYLNSWVLERKRTAKIENLVPSDFFKGKMADWNKKWQDWHAKQKAAKALPQKPKPDDDDDDAGVDIFSVDDVCDIGGGEPLFLNFENEDWALMTIRWELHLMATAFKKFTDDADRAAIPEAHVAFYYQKYFKKTLNLKAVGKDTLKELTVMLKDTCKLEGEEPAMFSSELTEDASPEAVLKLAEEKRRERQRRIDAGDETARLNFTSPAPQGVKAVAAPKKAA